MELIFRIINATEENVIFKNPLQTNKEKPAMIFG